MLKPSTFAFAAIVQLPRPPASKKGTSLAPGALVLFGPPEESEQLALSLKLPGPGAIQNLLVASTPCDISRNRVTKTSGATASENFLVVPSWITMFPNEPSEISSCSMVLLLIDK